jgi:hypothetical protein
MIFYQQRKKTVFLSENTEDFRTNDDTNEKPGP